MALIVLSTLSYRIRPQSFLQKASLTSSTSVTLHTLNFLPLVTLPLGKANLSFQVNLKCYLLFLTSAQLDASPHFWLPMTLCTSHHTYHILSCKTNTDSDLYWVLPTREAVVTCPHVHSFLSLFLSYPTKVGIVIILFPQVRREVWEAGWLSKQQCQASFKHSPSAFKLLSIRVHVISTVAWSFPNNNLRAGRAYYLFIHSTNNHWKATIIQKHLPYVMGWSCEHQHFSNQQTK